MASYREVPVIRSPTSEWSVMYFKWQMSGTGQACLEQSDLYNAICFQKSSSEILTSFCDFPGLSVQLTKVVCVTERSLDLHNCKSTYGNKLVINISAIYIFTFLRHRDFLPSNIINAA